MGAAHGHTERNVRHIGHERRGLPVWHVQMAGENQRIGDAGSLQVQQNASLGKALLFGFGKNQRVTFPQHPHGFFGLLLVVAAVGAQTAQGFPGAVVVQGGQKFAHGVPPGQ